MFERLLTQSGLMGFCTSYFQNSVSVIEWAHHGKIYTPMSKHKLFTRGRCLGKLACHGVQRGANLSSIIVQRICKWLLNKLSNHYHAIFTYGLCVHSPFFAMASLYLR